jgi:hypothetical protein
MLFPVDLSNPDFLLYIVDIFIMAGKRKQLSNDIKNVIVEMRKSGHKLQEIADTLNIPRGTVPL